MTADEHDIASILPFAYESLEEVNRLNAFTVQIGRTLYVVNPHFDQDGKESVFRQMKKLVLADS